MNQIQSAKTPKTQPTILSIAEVNAMINASRNLKHRAIIALQYSSGIRLQECIDMQVSDSDRTKMLVRVRDGKGRKERLTIVSKTAHVVLRR